MHTRQDSTSTKEDAAVFLHSHELWKKSKKKKNAPQPTQHLPWPRIVHSVERYVRTFRRFNLDMTLFADVQRFAYVHVPDFQERLTQCRSPVERTRLFFLGLKESPFQRLSPRGSLHSYLPAHLFSFFFASRSILLGQLIGTMLNTASPSPQFIKSGSLHFSLGVVSEQRRVSVFIFPQGEESGSPGPLLLRLRTHLRTPC